MAVDRKHKLERAKAIAKAKLFTLQSFVVFDTETTGLGDDAEMVEIAIIEPDGATLFETLVKPSCPIPAGASDVHGITDADVANAPTPDDVMHHIAGIFKGKRVMSYNLEYDRRILSQTAAINGIDWKPDCKRGCIMELYSAFNGEWDDYHGNYRWQRLDRAMAQSGVKVDGQLHRALADARGALGVLRYMAGR